MRRALVLLPCLVLAACDTGSVSEAFDADVAPVYENLPDASVADSDDYRRQRARLVAHLDDLIGDATAESARACTLLPVGLKACGGPTAYRVYARTAPEAGEILQTGRRLVALDDAAARRLGLTSTCEMVPEPAVVFEGGRCLARYRTE